jgi:hypothetical protein
MAAGYINKALGDGALPFRIDTVLVSGSINDAQNLTSRLLDGPT